MQGAWGFWYLPGSPSFHINWTGLAEFAGGLGLILGRLNRAFAPSWLHQAAAFGLFLLTVVVSPANIYVWSHNALPLSDSALARFKGKVLPQWFHVIKGITQVIALATFLAAAGVR
jgi:uncharacterized membrane protein